MRKFMLLLVGLFYYSCAVGQLHFNNRFDLDLVDAADGIQPLHNGYIIACTTIDIDSNLVRVQTLAIDSLGNILSNYSFFKPFYFYYGCWNGGFCQRNQFEYALAGTVIDTTGNYDLTLYKFNEFGDTLMMKRYINPNVEIGRSAKSIQDAGFIVVGQSRDTSTSNHNIFLMKTDSVGNVQWQRYFDQSNYDEAVSIIQTKDNGFFFGGAFQGNGSDVLVIKTDTMGIEQWRKTLVGQYSQSVWDVIETQDTNYVITGSWQVNGSGYQYWLMKMGRDSGNTVWQRFYGAPVFGKGFRSIIELNDGSLVCAGLRTFNFAAEPYYGTIFKFSANGDSLWERNYLPPNVVNGWGYLNDIIATSDGGFIAVGEAGGDGLTQDTWILKVDSIGCEVWNCLATDILEQRLKEPALVAYPNPVSGNHIQLKFTEPLNQEALLQIFNSVGELIFEKEVQTGIPDEQLIVGDYASGLYLVKVTGKNILLQTRFTVLHQN